MGDVVRPAIAFVSEGPDSPEAQALLDADLANHGHVMNLTRIWAHQPSVKVAFFELIARAAEAASLSERDRGVLITAGASTLGDSYCSLAWGRKLTAVAGDPEVAACVLRGGDELLDDRERTLAAWARQMARDPNSTTTADLDRLRGAGFDDAQILALTTFIALRLAFATVNDALGIQPDHGLLDVAGVVRSAVTYGRDIASG